MQIKPRSNKVLVKILPKQEILKNGLVIPINVKSVHGEHWNAEVIAVGPGKAKKSGVFIPLQVTPGDQVTLGKFAGIRVIIDHKMYFIVSEEEILCVNE